MVKCDVPGRGWMNGIGGCPNVGGIRIACTMPGFPDKFMPLMDEPPGAKLSTTAGGADGGQGTQVAAHRPGTHHRLPAAPVTTT